MNVNNSPVPPSGIGDLYRKSELAGSEVGTDGVGGTQLTARSAAAGANGSTEAGSNDDVHLSELVRTLRSLAADSPERQERIERLARSYVNGSYQVDAQATADGVISDSMSAESVAA